MSLDTEMWVATATSVGPALRAIAEGWEQNDDEWSFEGDGWQLLVCEPEKADPSEADPTLQPVGDRSHRIELVVEPIGTPEATQLLVAAIKAIATELDGLGLHPETGEPITR